MPPFFLSLLVFIFLSSLFSFLLAFYVEAWGWSTLRNCPHVNCISDQINITPFLFLHITLPEPEMPAISYIFCKSVDSHDISVSRIRTVQTKTLDPAAMPAVWWNWSCSKVPQKCHVDISHCSKAVLLQFAVYGGRTLRMWVPIHTQP